MSSRKGKRLIAARQIRILITRNSDKLRGKGAPAFLASSRFTTKAVEFSHVALPIYSLDCFAKVREVDHALSRRIHPIWRKVITKDAQQRRRRVRLQQFIVASCHADVARGRAHL